ncbi:Cell division protein FtsA [Buchnera aphidicola (Cinara kochiana kochiana)]|uniref:Cell division protein FtsA n=1 Tax=Buchnera aphidicola (Cinara kochiana kochiana) TaxID=2518976 RepID=A0A451D5C6_9GAMM|nr:cell division protein FtsA [Buchnera aphidicola]VFP81060.1 Cell division protein FtsA [Buchnera aphidicola (Cinara kochiana kochiana)]
MNLLTKKNIIAGLEIGTTKIIVLIGEILECGSMNIIGFSKNPTQGIEKGNINNLELLINCINTSIHEAEKIAKYKIHSVYLSISHNEINCQNEIGITPIKNKEITKKDIETVIKIAKSVKIKNNHDILHIIPQEFRVDHQSGIKNPIGLSGIRMQTNVHLITGNKNIKKNIINAIKKCGIHVKKIIFSGLASGLSVLTEEEKNSGVCLIDMGGETMHASIYIKGSLYHNIVIPYAGNSVTRDIAYAFSLSYSDAEFIKKKYGYATADLSMTCQNLDILNKNGKKIDNCHYQSLTEVIEPRYTELLYLVKKEIVKLYTKHNIKKNKYQEISNVVLTGGSSKIKYLLKCAKKIFHTQVMIKKPCNISKIPEYINKPEYATIVGLLQYGKNYQKSSRKKNKSPRFLKYLLNQIKYWLTK